MNLDPLFVRQTMAAFEDSLHPKDLHHDPLRPYHHEWVRRTELDYKQEVAIKAGRILTQAHGAAHTGADWFDTFLEILEPHVARNLAGSPAWLPRIRRDYEAAAPGARDEVGRAVQSLSAAVRGLDGDVASSFNQLLLALRRNRLSANYSILAYVAFASNPDRCAPIAPEVFDGLAKEAGLDIRFSHKASGGNYEAYLDVLRAFSSAIADQGWIEPSMVEVHSIAWIVGQRIQEHGQLEATTTQASEMTVFDRIRLAKEHASRNELIGWRGEELVFRAEQERLAQAGLKDLAAQVEWRARADPRASYDIRSFHAPHEERHLEVKATRRDAENVQFFLSENERRLAESDKLWELVVVSDIDRSPVIEWAGNPVRNARSTWRLDPSSWQVIRAEDAG